MLRKEKAMNKIKSISAAAAAFAVLLTGCGTRSTTVDIIDTPIITVTITEAVTETETASEADTVQTEETEAVTEAETDVPTESETSADEGYPVVDDSYVEYHFRSKKLLNQHYEKHGAEFDGDFDYDTPEKYEVGASDVINNDNALFKYEKEDGDEVYYIEATNEFVILSKDGYIRTYFRPNSGKKYFDRQ